MLLGRKKPPIIAHFIPSHPWRRTRGLVGGLFALRSLGTRSSSAVKALLTAHCSWQSLALGDTRVHRYSATSGDTASKTGQSQTVPSSIWCHGSGMMKLANIAFVMGIEPTFLVFLASVLTIIPSRLLHVSTWPMSICLCSSLPQWSVQTTTLVFCGLEVLTGSEHTYYIACNLFRILVMVPVSWGWWKSEMLHIEKESNPHLLHYGPVW